MSVNFFTLHFFLASLVVLPVFSAPADVVTGLRSLEMVPGDGHAHATISSDAGQMDTASVEVNSPILGLLVEPYAEGVLLIEATNTNADFPAALQRRQSPSGDWEELVSQFGASFFYFDRALSAGTTYDYRLMMLPDVESSIVSFTIPPDPPQKPENLRFNDISATQIELRWSQTALATGFRIERQADSSVSWMLLANVNALTLSYRDTTAEESQSYTYRVTAFNDFGDSPSTVTFPVKVEDTLILMSDDFEPERHAYQWDYTTSTYSEGGEGFNGSKALRFGNSGERLAQTYPLDVRRGGLIEFSFRAGDSDEAVIGWNKSEPGDEVVLEYSTDGSQWVLIQEMDTVYPEHSEWTSFSIAIPEEAHTATSRFRWRQKANDGLWHDVWALDNVKIRTGPDGILSYITTPAHQLVMAGSSVSLSVSVNQPEASFQWSQNNSDIPGATLPTYNVTNAGPDDSGSYLCRIFYGNQSLKTSRVIIGVFEKTPTSGALDVPTGGSFGLGMQVHPADLEDDLTYSWSRIDTGDLVGIGTVTGDQTSGLAVANTTLAAEASYQCRVNYQTDTSLEVGPFDVRLLRHPVILPIQDTEVVSGSPVDIPLEVTNPPVLIQVTGLPKGLYYDADRQRILGSTTETKSHTVTVKADNSYGVAEAVSFQLSTVGFPASLAGVYRGVFVEAVPALPHGGWISFMITNKGTASGSVMIRGKNCRFAIKSMTAAVDGSYARLEAPFKDPDGNLLILGVDILGGAGLHEALLSTGGDEGQQILAEGHVVRNTWSKANPAPDAGLINAALLLPDSLPEDAAVPEGTGFLCLRLTSQGIVTCKGRLADGQTVTSSTVLGAEGHLPFFVNLYRGTGSFAALMTYTDSQADGSGQWSKDHTGDTSKDRIYKNGFIRHALTVSGGLYQRPGVNIPVFASQSHVPSLASLTFTGAGLEEPGITQILSFNGKHQAVLSRKTELNPHGITFKLKTATGTFTGKFKIEDAHPLKSTGTLRRSINFQGCIIPGLDRGCGYFLLPELPSVEVPRNMSTWSGSVELSPVRDD